MVKYRKRYNKRVIKRYVAKRTYTKTNRPRTMGISDVALKCEYYDTLTLGSGANLSYKFNSTSANYLDISAILQGSPSFTEAIPLYGRYKITGISVKASRILPESDLVVLQMPTCDIAFYPQATSYNSGDSPSYNDNKGHIAIVDFDPQTKYWGFKDNYFEASSGGYGTWNNMGDYTTLGGELSINNVIKAATDGASVTTELQVCVYVKLSARNR
nr:MAG: capsid protein [Cressdnaviricota sp.]